MNVLHTDKNRDCKNEASEKFTKFNNYCTELFKKKQNVNLNDIISSGGAAKDKVKKAPVKTPGVPDTTVVFEVERSYNASPSKTTRNIITNNIEYDDIEREHIERALKLFAIFGMLVLMNLLISTYWYKKKLNLEYKEMTIKDNNNSFNKKLEQLHEYFSIVSTVKKINTYDINDQEYKDKVVSILDKFKIISSSKTDSNGKSKLIFSKYNSGGDYTIIDSLDIENIANEKLYYVLSEVIKKYECCSYFNINSKKVLFPYTELTINLIFYIITFVIIIYMLTNNNLNPIELVNRIAKKNKPIISLQKGGGNKNDNKPREKKIEISDKIVLFILIIYTSLGLSYKIYNNSFYYKNSMYN